MLETLAANGLGEHVSSWLSNNPNLPINPQQIHDALGGEQVQELARQTGLPVSDVLCHLADHLPAAASQAAGMGQNEPDVIGNDRLAAGGPVADAPDRRSGVATSMPRP